ncbi:MAG: hypothetical protein ACI96P_001862, partial [Candidatus Azotimanducaceae bacterium]
SGLFRLYWLAFYHRYWINNVSFLSAPAIYPPQLGC